VNLPADKGIYTLYEEETCLFVAGTEDIQKSIANQRRIADVTLFQTDLWRPDPTQLFWKYARMSNSTRDFRLGSCIQ
jgi:hypothetical protein